MIDKERLSAIAKGYGIALREEQIERFDLFATLLAEWNRKINLTAITEPSEILVKHFEDCLALYAKIQNLTCKKIADVGTGAGFPAIPILIASDNQPAMTMIEATGKKLQFIAQVLSRLSLSAELLHARAEELGKKPAYRESFDLVTARAVANLQSLSEYCLPLVKIDGYFAAMKASLFEDEIKDAEKAISVLGGKIEEIFPYHLSNGDARAVILIRKIKPTPPKYPRASALISKKPISS